MSENLGTLEYEARISDKKLEEDIKSIDTKIKKTGAEIEKSLNFTSSINVSKASKQMQGQFQESIQSIGKTNTSLKRMGDYYRELETSAAKAHASGEKAAKAEQAALIKDAKLALQAQKALDRKQKTQDKATLALEKSIAAKKKANASEKARIANINKTTAAYNKQNKALQSVKRMAAQYVSVYAAVGILNNIREVTGEFELQNKALAAIIQNKDRANKLFSEVTDLALKSPFGIRELLSYTKQLAAYRVETESLIPTLKNLADVSAGLGVDMNRMILAYGQVRAASVLRGCFGLNTPVLKADKTSDFVQNIKVGDVLLGDDNTNRIVSETIKGREQMYWIKQSNAENYRVNHNHIMTLLKDGELVDIYLYDLLNEDISKYKGVNAINGNISDIKIEKDIIDDYYGFVINGNKRFLLKDGSIVHNTELRQFTEAGIPMVSLLADKFSELEGRVVSTNEVFDKISNRAVSFKMVSDVFTDMTAKGGMFFDAQRVQAETLAGMWNIFGDALDKTYNQIGKANMDVLKGGVEGATDLVRNWESVLGTLKSLVVAFGAYKVTQRIVNIDRKASIISIIRERNAITSMTFAEKRANIEKLRTAQTELKANIARSKSIATINKLRGALSSLSGAAIIGIGTALYESYQNAQRLTKELDSLFSEGGNKAGRMSSEFKELARSVVEAADGSKDQKDAFRALNGIYKEYLPNQELTIKNLKDMKGNYDEVTEAINTKIEAQTREKMQDTINQEFAKKSEKAAKSFIEALIGSDKFTREQASSFAASFRKNYEQAIKSGGSFNYGKELNKGLETFLDVKLMDKWGINYIKNMEAVKQSGSEFLSVFRELDEEQKKAENFSFSLFGSGAKMKAELEGLKNIENKYKELQKTINATGGLSDEILALKNTELEKSKINETIKLYETLRLKTKETKDVGTELFYTKQIEVYKKKLEGLVKPLRSYTEVVREIIEKGQGETTFGQIFSVGENEESIKHGEKVAKAYKKIITDISATKGIIKGLGEKDKKEELAALERLEIQRDIAKTIIDTMGISLEKSKKSTVDSTILTNLRAQLDLLKKIKDSRADLGKILSGEDVEVQIQKLFGQQAKDLKINIPISSDTDAYYKQLESLANEASLIGGKAGKNWAKGLRNQIGDMQVKEITKAARNALKDLNTQVGEYKGKFQFYKDVLGITGNEEIAIKLAFEGDESATDFIDTLKKKVESLAYSGKFNISPNLDFDSIKKLDDLPEEVAKAVDKVDKIISRESNNTLLKRLKFLETKTPEGVGLSFDFSDIITDAIKETVKLKREVEEISKNASRDDVIRINKIKELQFRSISEQARQRVEKMGSAYTKERLEIDGLGEVYRDMTNASISDLDKIINTIKKGQDDLLSGDSVQSMLNNLKLDSDISSNLFDDIFNSTDINSFIEKVNELEDVMKDTSNIKVGTKVINKEQILKIQEFITLLKAMGIANANALGTASEKKIKKQISEWKELNSSLNGVIGTVRDLGSAFGENISESGERAINTIQSLASGVMSGIEQTARLTTEVLSSVEKASVILAIISAALKITEAISNTIDSFSEKDIISQKEQTAQVSKRLDVELAVNEIMKERNKLQKENILLGRNAGKEMTTAFDDMDESAAKFDDVMNKLAKNAIFSKKESWKNLWGFGWKKDKEFDFSVESVFGDKNSGGNSPLEWWFTAAWDKLDIFGKAGKGKAKEKAFKGIVKDMEEALAALGKTSADIANFSSEDWFDFFKVMKASGDITDKATLKMIENAEAAHKAYEEAMKKIDEIIVEIAGNLKNELGDALQQGFEQGINGADKFKVAVENMLEDMLKKQLINTLFADQFDTLAKEMKRSFKGVGADKNWVDDIERFFNSIEGRSEEANKLFEKFREEGKKAGFDLFGSDTADLESLNMIKGSLTEDTARRLESLMNSIREGVIMQGSDIKIMSGVLSNMYALQGQGLTHLATISQNTTATKAALESVLGQGTKGTAIRVIME